MPGFLVLFCLLTIFVIQLLSFHVPLPIIGQTKTVMTTIPTLILFVAQWFLIIFIFQAFRETVPGTENGTTLVKRKPKRGKKAKEKTAPLLVNYEKRLGTFHPDPSIL